MSCPPHCGHEEGVGCGVGGVLCGYAGAEVVVKDSSGVGLSEVLSLFEIDMPWVGALGGRSVR